MRRYKVTFNHNRQSIVFVVHGNIEAFRGRYKMDAWFEEEDNRLQRRGKFGELHLPRVSRKDPYWHELITHEVVHAILGWILARNVKDLRKYIKNQEENIATMAGEITRKFWKAYQR